MTTASRPTPAQFASPMAELQLEAMRAMGTQLELLQRQNGLILDALNALAKHNDQLTVEVIGLRSEMRSLRRLFGATEDEA